VLGALNSGSGFIRFCGTEDAKPALLTRCPSVTFGAGRVQAWLVGSGWPGDPSDRERFKNRAADGVPMVIDAGALQVLKQLRESGGAALPPGCLLTPHAGELASLLGTSRGEVERDPLRWARMAAERFAASVLLKGSTQYSVAPDGSALIAVQGPAWTAQAGSGDVLAGIAGTLLAAGLDAQLAGAVAASVQAMTAARNPGPLPPDSLAEHLPEVIGAGVSR
jgi:NAD(P)H-hydrate repair Nnr-like enzyme with NAD(P)H-hydrate dehydratase domain